MSEFCPQVKESQIEFAGDDVLKYLPVFHTYLPGSGPSRLASPTLTTSY